MLTTKQKIIEVLILLVLSLFLPTLDIFSDVNLIIHLYIHGHPNFAALLLVPFLLNYFLAWRAWWRIDKKKHLTFIAPLLSCYTQFCAVKIMYAITSNSSTVSKKKRCVEREVFELEVFAEAVLSTLVMTMFLVHTGTFEQDTATILGETSVAQQNFYLAYTTSILSASLGMAKVLKIGACRVLAEGGLCTGRFVILFISVLCSFVSKGLFMAMLFYGSTETEKEEGSNLQIKSTSTLVVKILFTIMIFLPGFLLSMLSLCCYKGCLKSILNHPSLLLLPTFTYYTFSTNRRRCCCSNKEAMVSFSRKLSAVNLFLYTILYMLTAKSIGWFTAGEFNVGTLVISSPFVLGIFFTLLFLFLDCCCCCCKCSPELEHAVLVVSDPLTEHVEYRDNGVLTVIPMEEYAAIPMEELRQRRMDNV